MRRLRSALQTIRAFLQRDARATLRVTRGMWNALTSHAAKSIFGLLLLIAAFPIGALLLWPFWPRLYNYMAPQTPADRINIVVLVVQGIGVIVVQGIGVIGILFGLRFTWLRERTVQIAQEGQITERFARAIGQLGDTKLEVRLGGIYALERIARDSTRDHWTIMEVLTAYVRENAR